MNPKMLIKNIIVIDKQDNRNDNQVSLKHFA